MINPINSIQQLTSNLFQFKRSEQQDTDNIYEYNIKVSPVFDFQEADQDTQSLFFKTIKKALNTSKAFQQDSESINWIIFHQSLYSPIQLQEYKYEFENFEFQSQEYSIQLEQNGVEQIDNLGFIILRIYRKLMKNLGLQLIKNDLYIDPENETDTIDEQYVLIKSFESKYVQQEMKNYLQVLSYNKIVSKYSYLNRIQENILKNNDFADLKGETVFIKDSAKQFKVDKICTDMNPQSIFTYNNEEITFIQYYERKNIQIYNLEQPLIETSIKEKNGKDKKIHLVPEVCFLSGENNIPVSQNKQIQQELMDKKYPELSEKYQRYLDFVQRIKQNPKNIAIFEQWKIYLEDEPEQCQAQIIDPGHYQMKNKIEDNPIQKVEITGNFKDLFLKKEGLYDKIALFQPYLENNLNQVKFMNALKNVCSKSDIKNNIFPFEIKNNINNNNVEYVNFWVQTIKQKIQECQLINDKRILYNLKTCFIIILTENDQNIKENLRKKIQKMFSYELIDQYVHFITEQTIDHPDTPTDECKQLLEILQTKTARLNFQIPDLPKQFQFLRQYENILQNNNKSNQNIIFGINIDYIRNHPNCEYLNSKLILSVIGSKSNIGYEVFFNESRIIAFEDIQENITQITQNALSLYSKQNQIPIKCIFCKNDLAKNQMNQKNKNINNMISIKQEKVQTQKISCASCQQNIQGIHLSCSKCHNINLCFKCANLNNLDNIVVYRSGNYVDHNEEIQYMGVKMGLQQSYVKGLQKRNGFNTNQYQNNQKVKLVYIKINEKSNQKFFQKSFSEISNPSTGTLITEEFTQSNKKFYLLPHNVTKGLKVPVLYEIIDFTEDQTDDFDQIQQQFTQQQQQQMILDNFIQTNFNEIMNENEKYLHNLQILTFRLSFLSVQWYGFTKYPCITYYAQKYADKFLKNYLDCEEEQQNNQITQTKQQNISQALYFW